MSILIKHVIFSLICLTAATKRICSNFDIPYNALIGISFSTPLFPPNHEMSYFHLWIHSHGLESLSLLNIYGLPFQNGRN